MPLEKLPVPEIVLSTQDVGSVFQGKMNAAIESLRNAIIAFNNQVDAALTASQQVDPAPQAEALAGTNNTYKMTPLRSMQQLQQFGFGGLAIDLADFTAAGPNVGRLYRFTNTAVSKPSMISYGSVLSLPYDGSPSTYFLGAGLRADSTRGAFFGYKSGASGAPVWYELWDKTKHPLQSSVTDISGGFGSAPLTPGSFGLGTSSTAALLSTLASATLDTLTIPSGFYRIIAADPGTKPPGYTDFTMAQLRYNSSDAARLAIGTTGEAFTYASAGGVWNATGWRRQYDTLNALGNVNHDGTKNTGGLLEYGSNANGVYYKYACGRLECILSRTNVAMLANTDDVFSWTFPAAFVSAPLHIGTFVGGASVSNTFNVNKSAYVSQLAASVTMRTNVSVAQNHVLTHVAIGRWR